jgi:LysM repeat protein
VKSGDTLIKIASDHKTTVRALRTANNLRTDSIKVGQKLKIPVKMADAGTGPMASNNLLPH